MGDVILLEGLAFYAHHGVYEEEKALGQRYEVDVEMKGDFSEAATSDALCGVNYAEVYSSVKEVVEGNRFNLIEKLCRTIAEKVVGEYGVDEATVRVRKPHAPIGGPMDYVQVEMTVAAGKRL